MDNSGKVIAQRSGWLVSGQIILWISTLFFLALAIIFSYLSTSYTGEKNIVVYIVWFWLITPVFFGVSLYYSKQSAKTPKILAEYRNGILFFYPSKSQHYAVRPGDIDFIAQKNYSGRGITYASGKLRIETTKGVIDLKWVKDVDNVRRAIEGFKNNRR